jgi:hypothetical protein
MGRSALIPYLYEHSEWIEDLFTGAALRGGFLEIPEGEDALEAFSDEDLRKFSAVLNEVPPPNGAAEVNKQLREARNHLRESLRKQMPDGAEFQEAHDLLATLYEQLAPTGETLEKEFENLRALVKLAIRDDKLTLVRSIS